MPVTQQRLPSWVVNRTGRLGNAEPVIRRLRKGRLVTVCEEARCPNIGECFDRGTATFMLLGDTCTRRCAFCSVTTGRPRPVDPLEPARVAETAAQMGLRYVVVTTVARDDLADEGAGQFVRTIAALRKRLPGVEVEVLTGDFNGREELLGRVIAARPDVFGHNLETVRRVTPQIRGRATYDRSLEVLRVAGRLVREQGFGLVKSGVMVGLGETREELSETMKDIRSTGCSIITVGQYLRPTRAHHAVARYVEPHEFEEIAAQARAIGFAEVASGALVRSSYRADKVFATVRGSAP